MYKILSYTITDLESAVFPDVTTVKKWSFNYINTEYPIHIYNWFQKTYATSLQTKEDIKTMKDAIFLKYEKWVHSMNLAYENHIDEFNEDPFTEKAKGMYSFFMRFRAIQDSLLSQLPRIEDIYTVKDMSSKIKIPIDREQSELLKQPHTEYKRVNKSNGNIIISNVFGAVHIFDSILPPLHFIPIKNDEFHCVVYPKLKKISLEDSIFEMLHLVALKLNELHTQGFMHRGINQQSFKFDGKNVWIIPTSTITPSISPLTSFNRQCPQVKAPELWPRVILEWICVRAGFVDNQNLDDSDEYKLNEKIFVQQFGSKKSSSPIHIAQLKPEEDIDTLLLSLTENVGEKSLWHELCTITGWDKGKSCERVLAEVLIAMMSGDFYDRNGHSVSDAKLLQTLNKTRLAPALRNCLNIDEGQRLDTIDNEIKLINAFNPVVSNSYAVTESADIYSTGIWLAKLTGNISVDLVDPDNPHFTTFLNDLNNVPPESLSKLLENFISKYNDVRCKIEDNANIPDKLKQIILTCVSQNPHLRPTASELIALL